MARRQGVLAQGGRLGREHGGSHGSASKARGAREARSVGSGLRAKLGEIEVGAGSVSDVHGLVQAALGVVSIEDDAVEQDADDLDDDLDDDADEGPVLETADQAVLDLVREDDGSGILDARPSPHVLVVAVVLGVGEDGGCKDPENQADDELHTRVSISLQMVRKNEQILQLTHPIANMV